MKSRKRLAAVRWLTKDEQRLGMLEAGPWLVVDVVDGELAPEDDARRRLVEHVYREVQP